MDEISIIAAILSAGIISKGNPSNATAEVSYATGIFAEIEKALRAQAALALSAKS